MQRAPRSDAVYDAEDKVPSRPRPSLPHPIRSDGDRKRFRRWKLEIESKLAGDGASIGDSDLQFMYIYSRLDGSAQKIVTYFYEQKRGCETPTAFLAYLEKDFGDRDKANSAMDESDNLRQKPGQSVVEFVARFEKMLVDSGEPNDWFDKSKIYALRKSINPELCRLLAIRGKLTSYDRYAEAAMEIELELKGVE